MLPGLVMSRAKALVCPACGSRNPLPLHQDRCASCGARIDPRAHTGAPQREAEKRFQQQRFSPAWFGISLFVLGVLTLAVLHGVPTVLPVFDFEGYAGAMVSVAIWFVGGVLIGLISPGRTFSEPTAAAVLVALPTAFVLFQGQTVKVWPAFMYVLMAAVGVAFALVGAYVGERVQMGPAGP
jgi:hypothetical protein